MYQNVRVPTFQIDHTTRALEGAHRLVVGGVAQLLAVHRQDGIAHIQSFCLIGGHAAEYLRDQDRHAVLATTLDRNAQAVVVRLDDAHMPLLVGHMVRYVAHIHAAPVAGIVVIVQAEVAVVVAHRRSVQFGVGHTAHALQRCGVGEATILAGGTRSASAGTSASSSTTVIAPGKNLQFNLFWILFKNCC